MRSRCIGRQAISIPIPPTTLIERSTNGLSNRPAHYNTMNTFLFVTLLIAAAANAASIETSSRMVDPIVQARRECRRKPALICNLLPVSGSSLSGKVLFTPAFRLIDDVPTCNVRVRASVSGLTSVRHGFHIHQYGDTSALDDGTSTGGHFANPDGTEVMHGLPNDDDRHWGDFGNLRNRDGVATYNRIDSVITLEGIVGRAITIHEGRDMGSAAQPSGAAGARQAICVIGYVNPINRNI